VDSRSLAGNRLGKPTLVRLDWGLFSRRRTKKIAGEFLVGPDFVVTNFSRRKFFLIASIVRAQ
jgi:hypothetical protein